VPAKFEMLEVSVSVRMSPERYSSEQAHYPMSVHNRVIHKISAKSLHYQSWFSQYIINNLSAVQKLCYTRYKVKISRFQNEERTSDEGNLDVEIPVLFLTEHHTMKAYWGSGDTAPHIIWPWH
jgi:hypothetical protein